MFAMQVNSFFRIQVFVIVAVAVAFPITTLCHAADASTSFAVPVELLATIKASKARMGDTFKTKTLQTVRLHSGKLLPKGTIVVGHIVDSRPFTATPSLAERQSSSLVSIRFDRVIEEGADIPIQTRVRAIASSIFSNEARSPKMDGQDFFATVEQIGGDRYSTSGSVVFSPSNEIVGYKTKQGVFARLLPGEYVGRYSNLHCTGSETEQSVAIFSANACGLYGFDASTDLAANGSAENNSVVTVESTRYTIELHSGTVLLLEVNGL
jgi:hypothetical protein